MAEEETEESDGLEIQVPISKGDYHSFCEKAKEVLRFHKVKPVIKGAEINFENEASFDGGTDWRFTGEGESIAISGCVGYPIDANSIKGITEGQKAILEAGIEIEFNLGEITPTASREGLSYDKKTQSVILAKLEKVSQELGQKLNDLFKDCKNIWEAKEIYKKNFEDSHFGYTLKQFCGEIKWKNEVISNSYFDFSDIKDCEVFKYRRYRGRRGVERIKKTKDVSISVDDKIYFNDLEKRGGLKRRIDTIFEDKNISSITVIKADSVAFAEIKKLENLDIESFIGNKIIRLSTIPKKVYLSGSRDVSDLAYVRTYELDISKVKQDYWHKPVGFWISAEIDFDEDDGIYLEVKRFVPLSISFRELSGKLSLLSRIGVKIDKIYGLKPSVVKKAKNNAWQSFDEFFEEAISEYIENNNLQMAYLASNKLGEFGDWVKLFKESEVTGFYKKFIHTYNELSKLGNNDKLNSIRNYLSVANFTEKLDSKFDISEKTLFSHYSLLEDIPFYRVENSQEGKGRILEYIKMVDSLAETAAPSEKNP
jgi:hypothetical protein